MQIRVCIYGDWVAGQRYRRLGDVGHWASSSYALGHSYDLIDNRACLGDGHSSWVLDLSDPDAIAESVPRVGMAVGIHILINDAGRGVVAPAEDQAIDLWDKTHAINLRAPWLMARAALPYLKASGAGRIVNMASQAAVVAIPEHAAYGSRKAGLVALTKVLAVEWARYGITVNAISPTVVETPMVLVGWSGEKGAQAKRDIPVGRFARPS